MTEKNFDRILQEKLASHESRVPDGLWSKIEKDIHKKRTFPFIPVILSVAGLLAIAWFIFSWNNKTDLISESKKTQTELSIISSKQSTNSTELDHSTSKNEIASEGANLTTEARVEVEESASSNGLGENQVGGYTPQSHVKGNSKPGNNSERSSAIESGGIVANSNQASKTQVPAYELAEERKQVKQEITTNKRSSDSKKSINEQTELRNINEKLIDSQSDNSEDEDINKEVNTKIIAESAIDQAASDRNAMELIPAELSNSTRLVVESLPLDGSGRSLAHGHFVYDPCSVKGGKKKNRVHCFSFVKQSEITFADFSIGPQYSHKILKTRNDEPSDLLREREATESYMLSYNLQARLGIKTKSGLTGMVGLSYDRYNERFDFFDPSERRTIIITNSQNDTTDVIIEAIGERTIKHTNTMTFVSLPFTAGYMWQTSKINVGVQGGLSLNLLFSKGGRIVTEDGTTQTLNGDAKKDIFKTSAGFSALGGITFEYKLRDNLSFIAEPQIKYNLQSLTKNQYSLDQKYLTAGINFGLRTIINKKITHKKKYGVN